MPELPKQIKALIAKHGPELGSEALDVFLNELRTRSDATRMKRTRRRVLARGEPYDRTAILEANDHACYLCGDRFDTLTLDHLIPLSRGGPDAPWNVLPACEPCNFRKDDRLLSELSFAPARLPDDPRVWVVLARGQRWGPDVACNDFRKSSCAFGPDRPPSGVGQERPSKGRCLP